MSAVRVVLSLLLPLLFWLITGGARLADTDVLVLMACACAFFWNAIWQGSVCRWMGADRFTYGIVYRTITGVATFIALGVIWRSLITSRIGVLAGFFSLGPITLGILLALLLASWALPLFTMRSQDPLPSRSERRELEHLQ